MVVNLRNALSIIRDMRANGYDDDKIADALFVKGFPSSLIEQAFAAADLRDPSSGGWSVTRTFDQVKEAVDDKVKAVTGGSGGWTWLLAIGGGIAVYWFLIRKK